MHEASPVACQTLTPSGLRVPTPSPCLFSKSSEDKNNSLTG